MNMWSPDGWDEYNPNDYGPFTSNESTTTSPGMTNPNVPATTTQNPRLGMTNPNVAATTASTVAGTTNEFVFPKGEDVKPYSGLPESYRDQLLSFAMPKLQEGIENLPQNIDTYTQNALSTYRQELNNSLKDLIPQQIGNLANRGILSSSMGENIISQTYSDAVRKSSGMGYQTAMEAAKMKTNIPQTIGDLLQYGMYSEDPTVMYGMLERLLRGQMV